MVIEDLVNLHDSDPEFVNEYSDKLLRTFYLREGETLNKGFSRPSIAYCYGDYEFAQRIYEYIHNGWFMYSSPPLSNAPEGYWDKNTPFNDKAFWESDNAQDRMKYWHGEIPKSMPISCFLSLVPDNIDGQRHAADELASLSVAGGGNGLHNMIRAVSDKAPGPIPYEKTVDANIGYYRQGRSRRGSVTYYLDITHPDVVEHIKFRVVTGGDPARKSDNRKNFHTGVNLDENFAKALEEGGDVELFCPHTKEVRATMSAKALWTLILETREKTGEPILTFLDVANQYLHPAQKAKGYKIHGSNLCNEIFLHTSEERTAVCCLSSVNLEKFDEWKDTNMIQDLIRLLDNILQFFIDTAPESMKKAVNSAKKERSLGLGAMGFHSYLQKRMIPFESGGFNSATQVNHQIFSLMQSEAKKATKQLAIERGEPEDLVGWGDRNAHLLALAPNANSGMILNVSPSIEAWQGVKFAQNTRAGTVITTNKHFVQLLKSKGLSDSEIDDVLTDITKNHGGSCQHLTELLTDHERSVFKKFEEIDQHWVVQLAEDRQQYICQGQSLNLAFPTGCDRYYVQSVHTKALLGRKLKGLYYLRTESKVKADTVKNIQRKAIQDWADKDDADCVGCQG